MDAPKVESLPERWRAAAQSWVNDPCWDLETLIADGEGAEPPTREECVALYEFSEGYEQYWEAQQEERLRVEAERRGVSVAAQVEYESLRARADLNERHAKSILRHYFAEAGVQTVNTDAGAELDSLIDAIVEAAVARARMEVS